MSKSLSIDIDALAELPAKSLLALASKQRECKRFFEEAARTVKDFPGLFLHFEEVDIDPRFDPDCKLISISLSGDGPKLGKLWGELRRAGFTCDARPKKGDTEFSGWFKQEGYARILVHFTSTLCKRVQVGVKTVEQPIYETVCGEELAIAAEARPALSVVGSDVDQIPF